MRPRPCVDPVTGKDEPGVKDWRNRVATMGEDLALVPVSLVGKPRLGAGRVPVPAAQRDAPATGTGPHVAGLQPDPKHQRASETKGERAVREIRAKLGAIPDAETGCRRP